MRVVVQRVKDARVEVANETVGKIEKGLMLLVGFSPDDAREDLRYAADKILNLRIFEDQEGKMNLSLLDIGGEILSVSQFTLYGDIRKGRRPGFTDAATPSMAEELYQEFNQILRSSGIKVETGIFGADMQVSLCNDGPVTFLLDSKKQF